MIGSGTDLSKFLVNFNSADWANQANAHLQSALNQALPYGEKYTQQAVNAVQDYSNQAQKDISKGYNTAQALNAPQHLATYNALDAYQNSLGLATPQGGSFQLAQAMNNQANGRAPVTTQQQNMVAGYNNGLLSGLNQGSPAPVPGQQQPPQGQPPQGGWYGHTGPAQYIPQGQ